ncbi:hypothetical protein C5Z25_06170 [Lactobacillus sp. CBA3605]|uniref:DUF4870 domain-containing protein n=1 Tax=Lactobacillus sp. CBA3605 TaxID=2099788 RepID=UPI000CFD7492|nr:DUF4870 domain-containing protein [Lactobacillus sp. CBA3605]AVK61378.1 hypothetical protein C5Z25_06170 [Lactobacillus sp. CBA3605]
MTHNRIINSLSYLSILFLPVLFPLIVWAVSRDNLDVHRTAAHAFWLHLLPAVLAIVFIVILAVSGFYMTNLSQSSWLAIGLLGVLGLVALVSYLGAIVRGIQYLVTE